MNGFISKIVAGSCLGAGVMAFTGCTQYRDVVDPCWFERYNSLARHSVNELEYAQSAKGHLLDQTVWNWHFEPDGKGMPTAVLNGAGMETLRLISRHLPAPDFQIYLQTAQDVPYSAVVPPEKIVFERDKLNERRIQAIQTFLATQAPMHGGGVYTVGVHDFVPPGMRAVYTEEAEKNFLKGFTQGKMQNFETPKPGQ
jgi:hypothetical protein